MDLETKLIFQGIHNNFQFFCQQSTKLDWEKLLMKSSFNRVLYLFTRSLLEQEELEISTPPKKNLEEIRTEGEHYLKKFSETVKFINSTLQKSSIPFLIAKTFKLRPYVTRDIDLLVKKEDLDRTLKAFENSGLKIESFKPKKQWDASGKGLLHIDIHTGFHWQGSTFLDDTLLWSNPGRIKLEEEVYPIPNPEVEASTVILNILFENMHISLLDFLYLRNIASKVNWKQIYEQSVKYGWSGAFIIFARIFNKLIHIFYPANSKSKINLPIANKEMGLPSPVSMPYLFSWSQGAKILGERIFKRRYIPYHDMAYFAFAKTRFHLTRGKRVPMYHHWFSLRGLEW